MMNRLQGKTAIITGATAGIGMSTAIQMAKSGVDLYITGRREEKLVGLKRDLEDRYGVSVTVSAFDIRNADACTKFVESIDETVDILVNNAGLSKGLDPVFSASFDDWDTMIDTNIKGLLYVTRLVSAQMKEHNAGHIINVGSIAGHESILAVWYTVPQSMPLKLSQKQQKKIFMVQRCGSVWSPPD